jgi:hypothetical protein
MDPHANFSPVDKRYFDEQMSGSFLGSAHSWVTMMVILIQACNRNARMEIRRESVGDILRCGVIMSLLILRLLVEDAVKLILVPKEQR